MGTAVPENVTASFGTIPRTDGNYQTSHEL
jgi:hypothetical protein